jgi:hypothetical protein
MYSNNTITIVLECFVDAEIEMTRWPAHFAYAQEMYCCG